MPLTLYSKGKEKFVLVYNEILSINLPTNVSLYCSIYSPKRLAVITNMIKGLNIHKMHIRIQKIVQIIFFFKMGYDLSLPKFPFPVLIRDLYLDDFEDQGTL